LDGEELGQSLTDAMAEVVGGGVGIGGTHAATLPTTLPRQSGSLFPPWTAGGGPLPRHYCGGT
jgi:hypothetical protein